MAIRIALTGIDLSSVQQSISPKTCQQWGDPHFQETMADAVGVDRLSAGPSRERAVEDAVLDFYASIFRRYGLC